MLKIFTDVLDPFLWGIYPKIRKYEFFYDNFEYDFVMTGLIGNYEEFLPKNFREKNTVELGNKILFDMYRATATITHMPGFNEVPKLYTKEYNSTYTLDKYYLSFKEIDENNSKKYLKRLLECAIIFGKNIFLREVQGEILKEFDVDYDEFFMEYEMIDETFLSNRMLAFDYRIKKQPGLLVEENNRVIQNILKLDMIDSFILENMDLVEKDLDKNSEETLISYLKKYDTVIEDEINLVFGKDNKLNELLDDKKAKKTKFGNINVIELA